MIKTITTDGLRKLRKSAEGFVLIDVLSKEQFEKDKLTMYGTYNNEKQQRFFGQWFENMKNIADVKDYRIGY